ncbi:hypothetical protein ABPG75_003993 [Micractinium tetrahymenae]
MTIAQEEDSESRLALRLEELQLPALDSYVSPRSFSWLGDHQDEAAELAALLHEAAPRLALASLRTPPVGSGGRAQGLPKARSYDVSDTVRDRLSAAVPMPTGPGQIDWSRLSAIISSEMLKFDEATESAMLARLQSLPAGTGVAANGARAAAAAPVAAGAAAGGAVCGPADDGFAAPAPTPAALASPRTPSGGDMLEINSGGRVIFCLFSSDPPRAPTPPCSLQSSLRSSPEKEAAGYTSRAGQLGEHTGLDPAAAGMAASHPSTLLPGAEELPPTPDGWRAKQARSDGGGGRVLFTESSLWAHGRRSGGGQAGWQAPDEGSGGSSSDDYAEERQLQAAAAVPQQQQWHDQQGGADDSAASSSNGCRSSGSSLETGRPRGAGGGALDALANCGSSFSFARSVPGAAGDTAAGGGPGAPCPVHLPGGPLALPCAPGPESCLILKFVSSRLLCQSEQFASELTRHVGLCTPDSRILRQKGATEQEWRAAYEAAAALKDRFPDLHEEMTRNSCCLVMEYIPGGCLFKQPAAFGGGRLQQTAEDLGRLFTLDMLLGNADRLHCRELGWRGNPENIIYATAGRWAGRAVAIDAVVQRRPSGGLMSVEDSSCERLTELALNDAEVAGSLLRQALRPCSDACGPWEPASLRESAAAFQRGLKAALDAAVTIKGLLEMMFDVTAGWIDSFLEDIEADDGSGGQGSGGHSGPSGPPATTPRSASASRRVSSAGGVASPLLAASASTTAQTMRIRQINHEAQRNDSVGEKVSHWKGVFREKGEELRAAVEEWQVKRGTAAAAGAQRLTTAFLDGIYPIVDVYELKVRLEHMLQRLRVLQQATLTGRPCRLMPRLYLSGAVEASSHHLLRHLGITHILNATEDLLLPDELQGFVALRCPLRDVEEEDISTHLPEASAFIDEGLASGGAVLVHCHAGKSRSCSLVLAWLMTRRRWPLNRATEFLRRMRPEAAPNAGYLAALLRLEEGLFGRQTVKMKKTKPEPRSCPVCGEKVGLSADSVRVHLRLKHPGAVLARLGNDGSQDGSGNWAELLASPAGSSPRSIGMQSSPSGSGALPSPRSSALPDVLQQQQQRQAAQHQQQHQQQQATVAAAAAAAGAGQEDPHEGLWRAAPARPAAPIRTSAPASSCQAHAANPALPDSPPMAAVLQAAGAGAVLMEEGQLIEADSGVEEFLRTAAAEMG